MAELTSPNDLIIKLPAPVIPPLTIPRYFGNSSPLEIDAGSGKGRFLLARASRYPRTNFLAIERQKRRVVKTARKAFRANLQNVRILQNEICFILENFVPNQIVNTLYIFYPDPWPKRKHHPRRLIQTDFLDLAASKMISGGIIHFATDHLDYFKAAVPVMQNHPAFKPTDPFIPTPDEKTDFELIFESQGLKANRFSIQRQ